MAAPELLAGWDSFYVITGSSAAALTGLQFVVIALRTEGRAQDAEAIRAFGTPTVVHFCGVLLVAAMLSIPGQTRASVAWCVSAVGIAGLALSVRVVLLTRRQQSYAPVLSDWLWHVALPMVAYAAFLAAAVALSRRPGPALDLVAAATILLLFIGIHNAWDAAIWIAATRR
jgi:hypothetical protein